MESSKIPEEPPNSASEAETAAQTKRNRARRVSFADTEITSVHFFKRDDDSETPPDSNQSSRNPNTNSGNKNEIVGFFKDLGGDSDDSGDEDGRKSFFRPIGSPSPGSSTAGSATSNDEEIFFGPVSSNFIRRGQLSDSAVSSENNEETMDTTAFSMHYRSLVRSESGELMTPTSVRLVFEEKTPSQNTGCTKSGNSMSLTEPKKLINQPVLSAGKVRSGEDSDDMCIVGEKPNKYDYGSLPPTLDALLAEDGKVLHAESATDLINSQSSIGDGVSDLDHNGTGNMDQGNDIYSLLCHVGIDEMSVEPTSLARIDESEGSGNCVSKEDNCLATGSSISDKMSPSRIIRESKALTEDVFASGMSELGSTAISSITRENTDNRVLQLNVWEQCVSANGTSMQDLLSESSYKQGPDSDSIPNSNQQSLFPLEGPLLPTIQHQSILSTPKSALQMQSNVLSSHSRQSVSFISQDGIQRDRIVLSTQKSIPRFKIPDPSPAASSLKEGTNKLKSRLSNYSSMLSPFNDGQAADSDIFLSRCVDAPIACLEEQLLSVDLKNGEKNSTDITLLSYQPDCLEKILHTGTEIVQSFCGRSTTELPPTKSHSRKEPTESPSKIEFDHKVAWTESPESPSQEKPSQASHNKKAAMSPHMTEPRRSPRFRKEPPQSPSKKKQAQSPSVLNPPTVANNENIQSVVKEQRVSSKFNVIRPSTDDFHEGFHTLSSPLVQDAEISFEQKRRRESVLADVDHADKVPRMEKSSDVHGSTELTLDSNKNDGLRENVDGGSRQKSWPEILEKFSTDAKQLLSPSINKLNLRAIGKMEDVLVPFLKFKSSECQSQKIANHVSLRNKRVAEIKLSLYRIVCENAKLQLLRAKHQKLQKKRHLLSSGIQDCQILKLNYTQQQSESDRRDPYLGDGHLIYSGDEQVVSDKVSTIKQEIIALDGKIKSLSNSFHNFCKLKGEPSCTDIIALVHDHIQTRMECRSLRQDLQGWQVDDFKSINGCFSILLNYRGYLSQRFMLNSVPVSSIAISRELNDINIVKNFPNMDACVAFAFVLKAVALKKCDGSKYLVRETQAIRSLLYNLLDVLDEVQLARINNENLVQIDFYSPSVKQLYLKLCFINFYSGKKVTLTLDVTCLNSGVYPSEIIPHKVEASGSQSSLLDEISAAADNVEVGYLRITRLCRCISELWQASNA